MKKKLMSSLAVGLSLSTAPVLAQTPPVSQPNIIVILADDLGYAGLSSFGGEGIHTPHLDRLAEQGIKMTSFYATSTVCSPTRVGFLTGQYPQRVGLDHIYHYCQPSEGLNPTDSPSLPRYLKENGYRTGVFGKWHLGSAEQFSPKNHGFDDFVGFIDGNIDYVTYHNTESEVDWWVHHERQEAAPDRYLTEALSDAVVNFIEREKDNPFFIYFAEAAPHVPLQGPDDPGIRTEDFYTYSVQYHFPREEYMRRYSNMLTSMDDGVGRIMDKLGELDLLENTLVIFTSDNGGELTGVKNGKVNGNLRGAKVGFYEGGLRVPTLAYWKGTIEPDQVIDDPMITMDLFPTITQIVGGKNDAGFDGIDLTPALLKKQPLAERDLFWQHTHKLAMRRGDWKLIFHKKVPELYNLADDPQETTDLANDTEHEALRDDMVATLLQWRRDTAVGQPAERVIGEEIPYQSPCPRDLDEYNQGRSWKWTDKGQVIN